MKKHTISPDKLTIERIAEILENNYALELSESSKVKIEQCHTFLHKKIASSDQPVYGINTGFGALCNTSIANEELSVLQNNLVKSHACGMGEEAHQDMVKIMCLLKIHALSLGHSGVSLQTVERLIFLYNSSVFPVIYQQGSLGASGDLAPLAHYALLLIGEGEVYHHQVRKTTADALRDLGCESLKLEAKEGLALLNGTQFMNAYGVWSLIRIRHASKMADTIAALSIEAAMGRMDPFHASIHAIRPHKGQLQTATNIRQLLEGSEIALQEKKQVQDPYSFRCVPQVHGASKDAFARAYEVFEIEINSVTDNPTIFPEEDLIISAGNFHGQPLALTLDFLAIAVAELGSISERRIYKLISGYNGLPSFLISNPGINSGFMIPQYTAASIVSQNKQLCTPASVDTIDSSQGQEDHVSMGANAATKLIRVLDNVESILGIEAMNALQALSFRRPLKSSKAIERFVSHLSSELQPFTEDIYLHERMRNAKKLVLSYQSDEKLIAF